MLNEISFSSHHFLVARRKTFLLGFIWSLNTDNQLEFKEFATLSIPIWVFGCINETFILLLFKLLYGKIWNKRTVRDLQTKMECLKTMLPSQFKVKPSYENSDFPKCQIMVVSTQNILW